MTIGLTGLGLLTMVVFGLRNVVAGKVKPLSIAFIALPFVLMGALGLAMGDWTKAAIFTLFIVVILALVAIVLSSVRSLFS